MSEKKMKNKNFQKKHVLKRNFDSHSSKRVSYILPTKNRAKYLEKALLRYRNLIKAEDELIVVDGGSIDGTVKVVSRFGDIVDIFISEADRSATHAFNKGILLARGRYIKNLNDDDEIYPEAMGEAIKVLEKHSEVDVLVCGGTKQHESNYSVFYLPKGVNYGRRIEDVIKYGACGVGFIIKKESLAISGLIPPGLAGDANFILRCIHLGLNVKFCRINLFNHPVYPHSVVVAKAQEHEKDFNKNLAIYASKSFYQRYRIKRAIASWPKHTEEIYRRAPLFKRTLLPFRFLYKMMNRKRFGASKDVSKNLKEILSDKKYIWDGGFS